VTTPQDGQPASLPTEPAPRRTRKPAAPKASAPCAAVPASRGGPQPTFVCLAELQEHGKALGIIHRDMADMSRTLSSGLAAIRVAQSKTDERLAAAETSLALTDKQVDSLSNRLWGVVIVGLTVAGSFIVALIALFKHNN